MADGSFKNKVTGLKDLPGSDIEAFEQSTKPISEPSTPFDDGKEPSDWLIDFDNPIILTPTLQAGRQWKTHIEGASTVQAPMFPYFVEHPEAALRCREGDLVELERAIATRIEEVEAREFAMVARENILQLSWAELYSTLERQKADLTARESAVDERKSKVEVRETIVADLEKKVKIDAANLNERTHAFELLEESTESAAINTKEILKERQDRLDERKQLAVLDRIRVKRHVMNVASREYEVRKAEDSLRRSEDVIKLDAAAVESRKIAVKADEATLLAKQEASKGTFKALKYTHNAAVRKEKESNERFVKHLREQEELTNTAVVNRELDVLEREQCFEALETTLKLEREFIHTRNRD
ncbi:hypothetical protein SBOR_8779 [Sclerotinia borealis F-4128]|uniref:Uncharacterized protein n=1 Tax=Sclerotinia borealis (strain F-4128) TaxID=1432307 RepID=W9C7J6_SCLBF|nr:hypothetical protein SBOR_8779 [Sclerotinia borealis F-4128]